MLLRQSVVPMALSALALHGRNTDPGGTSCSAASPSDVGPTVAPSPMALLAPGCSSVASRPWRVYASIVWSVDLELIQGWLAELDDDSYEQVIAAVELLEERGPQLGRPIVDTVKASAHKNMKELRPGSSGKSELRVLFAFDPDRKAIMLVAGDKSGDWKNWYTKNISVADARFDAHLHRMKKTKGE